MAQVKVYSTPTCPYCVKVKDYLKQKNISFENLDVSSSEVILQEMLKVSGQMGVPVVVIDGEVIVGFDQSRIDEILGL